MRRKRKILEIAQLSKQMAKLKFSLFMMKNIFAPSHEKHAFAMKILHGSSTPNFYCLSFFARQFQRRSTTGWIIVIHMSKMPWERYLHSFYKRSPDADTSEHIQANKAISGSVLPWVLTMKLIKLCVSKMLLLLSSLSSLCCKHL